MKFVKSNLAKKLIIILIVLMIFNIALPNPVKAWDIAGILMKPLFSMVLSIMVTIDITMGFFLNGASITTSMAGAVIDVVTKDAGSAIENANNFLLKLFIGPDSIFSGKVRMLNANIFEVVTKDEIEKEIKELKESSNLLEAADNAGDTITKLGESLSPRK